MSEKSHDMIADENTQIAALGALKGEIAVRLSDELTAANAEIARLREALEGMVAEWDKMTRYGSPLAKQANENLRRARSALDETK